MHRFAPLLLLLPIAACVSPPEDRQGRLAPGLWIEAKGRIVGDRPLIDEVDEIERGESDKAEKVEVEAPVTRATETELELLGLHLQPDAETEYEDRDKQLIPPFVAATEEWVKVKLRHKDDGFKVRTVRKGEPRSQFQVTGELLRVDPELGELEVGGVPLRIAQDAAISFLGQRDRDDPLSLFLGDDQKAVPFTIQIGDDWRFGGQASLNGEYRDEFDLNKNNANDRVVTSARGKLDALWLFDRHGSYALFEAQAGRTDTFRENSPNSDDTQAAVTRAFASVAAHEQLQLLVGRQDFDEEREWLYDEVLDGVRAVLRVDQTEFEASASVGRDFAAEQNVFEDMAVFTGIVRHHLDPDWTVSAYALQIQDSGRLDHEPFLYGVRSFSRPRYGCGHWLELGGASGRSGGVDISGYAFDVGFLYAFDAPLRPVVGAGYAFASGAADGAGDQGYRQSLLNDNNAKMGGVTSVRYYGELLDPELSNLGVATLAAACRPIPNGSFSLLLHHYQQDIAAIGAPLGRPETQLRTLTNGTARTLGYEVDFVFGYRFERQFTAEFVAARFEPGSAYTNQDAASKLELTLRFSF